ncbi:hypothetical protein JDV02_008192 [Purpureocillium takamizusanense]|uniref:Aminoglycoside phosphotransferase domain-containing protein n=1 Tax=Purpureocillium takamizusanense TaxID=2060973 RepID=A0A9Q8QP28_9HYPO|nr:uncharacterized protein JDV02_008192 [Purpureocillium takamizusanense]UNI22291.1 hypothetical protein JDV02_008192 [Purpureocillium takamizusanense]
MAPKPLLSAASALAAASALRTDGQTAHLIQGTEDKPIQLGQTQIFVVQFAGGDVWAVRIAVHQDSTLSPDSVSDLVQQEAATIAKLNEAGFRWAPKLVGAVPSFDNPLSYPYMVVSWLPGAALEWSPSALADEQRHRILCQLAEIQLELAQCTIETSTEALAQQHLVGIVGSKVSRVMNGTLPEVDLRSCFVLRALLRKAVCMESPLLALTHSNLAAHKIIVDADCNITGIVDWKLACVRPLEVTLQFPRLLAVEPDEADASPTENPSVASIQRPPELATDRQVFLSRLSSISSRESPLSSLAATMNTILSDPNVDWKHLIIQSCFSRGIHRWMSERSWLVEGLERDVVLTVHDQAGQVVRAEIDDLVRSEPDWGFTREELLQSL